MLTYSIKTLNLITKLIIKYNIYEKILSRINLTIILCGVNESFIRFYVQGIPYSLKKINFLSVKIKKNYLKNYIFLVKLKNYIYDITYGNPKMQPKPNSRIYKKYLEPKTYSD